MTLISLDGKFVFIHKNMKLHKVSIKHRNSIYSFFHKRSLDFQLSEAVEATKSAL